MVTGYKKNQGMRMRTIIQLSAMVCFLATALAIQAQEYAPIEGAFGWTLGEALPQETIEMLPDEPDLVREGLAEYQQAFPPKPLDYFFNYQIKTEPGPGALVQIYASDKYLASLEEYAREDFGELKAILENKYGPSCCELPKEWIDNGYADSYQAERDGKGVYAYLREIPGEKDWKWEIYIEYIHWPLLKRTKAEDQAQKSNAL